MREALALRLDLVESRVQVTTEKKNILKDVGLLLVHGAMFKNAYKMNACHLTKIMDRDTN